MTLPLADRTWRGKTSGFKFLKLGESICKTKWPEAQDSRIANWLGQVFCSKCKVLTEVLDFLQRQCMLG